MYDEIDNIDTLYFARSKVLDAINVYNDELKELYDMAIKKYDGEFTYTFDAFKNSYVENVTSIEKKLCCVDAGDCLLVCGTNSLQSLIWTQTHEY